VLGVERGKNRRREGEGVWVYHFFVVLDSQRLFRFRRKTGFVMNHMYLGH
jgi:hypothetical protein